MKSKTLMTGVVHDNKSATSMSFVNDISIPKIKGSNLLVEVHSVALNPIDYKIQKMLPSLL